MSKEHPSIRTPIGRVRHLGPAGHGTSDFFRQRLTAIATGLLTIPKAAARSFSAGTP